MPANQVFHTHTALARGLRELLKQLQDRLSLRSPVNVYLAGGMTVHLYTASRVTTDVDAEFGGRVHLPNDLGVDQLQVYVLAPVDLAVSKIARFADNDKEDIAALVRLGLTTADEIEQRAIPALAGFVGGQAMLRLNLRDAVALARKVEAER
ncbi:MAG: hypothetical protein JSR49_07610 [Proteobacteria bacterium]|nr:hypothetical protein [Pseudomonadota bacterium]